MRPDTAVTTAEQEAAEAQALVDALAERVRDGNTDVTPDQLAAQQQLADFAQLRVEAARRHQARASEDSRVRRAEAARTAGQHLLNEDGARDIVAATVAAAAAMAELARVVEARNAHIAEVGATLAGLDGELTVQGADGSFPSRKYGVWGDPTAVVVQGVGRADRLRVGDLAAAVVAVGLGSGPEGYGAWSSAANLLNGVVSQAVKKLGEDVPGLAAAWRYTPQQWAAAGQRERHEASEQGRRPIAEPTAGTA